MGEHADTIRQVIEFYRLDAKAARGDTAAMLSLRQAQLAGEALDALLAEREEERRQHASLALAYSKTRAEREQAQEEIGRLRDRAVCSGCGQDVDEGGACGTEGCDDGEMIPSSDLPGALRSMMEERNEVRAELVDETREWRLVNDKCVKLSDERQQAIAALREVCDFGDRPAGQIATEALAKLGEQP